MDKQRRCEICHQIVTDGELNTGKVETSCDQEFIDKECGFAMVSRFRHKACINKANTVCKRCHGKGYIEREADGREHEVTDEAVRDAIAWANHEHSRCMVNLLFGDADCASLAITALQQMRTEPCDWCKTHGKTRFETVRVDVQDGVPIDYNADTYVRFTPSHYCPNCGRKLKGE